MKKVLYLLLLIFISGFSIYNARLHDNWFDYIVGGYWIGLFCGLGLYLWMKSKLMELIAAQNETIHQLTEKLENDSKKENYNN